MPVAVITASVPSRAKLLEECKESVRNQTVAVEHLVGLDVEGEGPAAIRGRLVKSAIEADWLLPLDDDDLLDPECVEVLESEAGDADVVYPWCRILGKSDWSPNRLFRPEALLDHNFIPVTALIRRDLWVTLGGMDESMRQFEDYDFWKRALAIGAKFKCVPEVLWTYRILASGQSRNAWQ